jgi:hypothetical protein
MILQQGTPTAKDATSHCQMLDRAWKKMDHRGLKEYGSLALTDRSNQVTSTRLGMFFSSSLP